MKNTFKLLVATAMAVGLAATVQAVPISGSIGFTGAFSQTGGTIGDLATATSFSITSASINSALGDLAGATLNSFASPIGVNGNPPVIGQLWSVDVGGTTYTFNVTSETQTLTSTTQINLAGNGTMSNGINDDTAGTWQLGFGVSGQGAIASFTWQSTSATNVPDGGMTVMLLGAALSGLGLIRKKFLA
jgi:hypothetical protein